MTAARRPITKRMIVDWIVSSIAIPCRICLVEFEAGDDIQWDHIHAVALDGPHDYKNIRPVHRKCHQKKTRDDLRLIKKARPGHAGKFKVMKGGEANTVPGTEHPRDDNAQPQPEQSATAGAAQRVSRWPQWKKDEFKMLSRPFPPAGRRPFKRRAKS